MKLELSHAKAKDLCKRFAVLPGWRDLDPVAVAEMAYQLISVAPDEAIAQAVVDRLLQREWLPRPCDFLEAAQAVQEARQATRIPKADPACPNCGGRGWMSRRAKVTIVRSDDGRRTRTVEYLDWEQIPAAAGAADGYSVFLIETAAPCTCPYGLSLEANRQRHGTEIRTKGSRRDDD